MDIDVFFDMIQRTLYRLCRISPREFWNYSMAECILMVEESSNLEKIKTDLEIILNAKLCAVVFNSQGGCNGKPVKTEEFLPKGFLQGRPDLKETTEDKIKNTLGRGNRLADRCNNGR